MGEKVDDGRRKGQVFILRFCRSSCRFRGRNGVGRVEKLRGSLRSVLRSLVTDAGDGGRQKRTLLGGNQKQAVRGWRELHDALRGLRRLQRSFRANFLGVSREAAALFQHAPGGVRKQNCRFQQIAKNRSL